MKGSRKWLLMFAIALVLFTALVIAYLSIQPIEDLIDAVGIRARNLTDKLNPSLKARADVVGEILQRVTPAETPARSEFIGSCMAMWRNESGFDPTIFNYYDPDDLNLKGKPKLKVVHYPDDENWKRAHACGIAQMVYLKDAGLTLETSFDAESNIAASLRRLNLPAWTKIMDGCPTADIQVRAALLYMGHGRGPATVPTAVSVVASGGDWDAVSAAVESKWGTGGLSFSNMWAHAANAEGYAAEYGGA